MAIYSAGKCADTNKMDGRLFMSMKDDITFLNNLLIVKGNGLDEMPLCLAIQQTSLILQQFLCHKLMEAGEKIHKVQSCVCPSLLCLPVI